MVVFSQGYSFTSQQDLTATPEKVSELKSRIENIMLVMVADAIRKKEENIPQDLTKDIEKPATCISAIVTTIFSLAN